MSYRSDRARRRAAKRRNQRIFLILAVLAVIIGIGFVAFSGILDRGDEAATESGLQIEEIDVGTGEEVATGDTIAVHYTGWLEDGTQFDSSLERGDPLTFTVGAGGVIQGWEQGVVGMKEGGKRRLTIPPELGYGEDGYPGVIPPNSTLIFEVELVDIE